MSTKQLKSRKAAIVITWNRREEPSVKLPASMKRVPVQFVDGDAVDSLLLDHNGVEVYWTVTDNYGDGFMYSDYWVATELLASNEDDLAFDLRDLPEIPKESQPKYRQLFRGDEHGDAKRALAYLIDTGKLTREGLLIDL